MIKIKSKDVDDVDRHLEDGIRTSMRKMVINLFQMMRRPPPHEVEVGQSPGKQRPRHDHS